MLLIFIIILNNIFYKLKIKENSENKKHVDFSL